MRTGFIGMILSAGLLAAAGLTGCGGAATDTESTASDVHEMVTCDSCMRAYQSCKASATNDTQLKTCEVALARCDARCTLTVNR
ncbi:hypothetical protein DRW03_12780 [Corallococcus sp. H22C18031201]|uniref:hypothetical protein n=1 Tax=Citreicoccus inhibens TaxID=2849499 RepID=UPI000E7506BC|nr:hypothetical protein [Citreicoccus inhibens]MBU8894102.1 hypothetical protein [Citreicoccus inhibens]RJS23185.1 hypothetical protein DRW03_12780 [Corallococcus sp. H22C18031201]